VRSWPGTPLRLWEVDAVDPGRGMNLRDTRTGGLCSVSERTGSSSVGIGDYVLARVVPVGDSHCMVGSPLRPELHHRASLIALLDSDPDAYDIAAWLGAAFSLPRMTNSDGQAIVLCRALLRPRTSTWQEVEARLDSVFERHDDTTWVDAGGVNGGDSVVRGFLRRGDDGLAYETNSEERLDRILATLSQLVSDLEVVEESRRGIEDVMAERNVAGTSPSPKAVAPEDEFDPPPELLEALDEFMREKEIAWVDESIPALGGLTPRQAALDPTRREDLERLLREMDRGTETESHQVTQVGRGRGWGAGFDPTRLRRMLQM